MFTQVQTAANAPWKQRYRAAAIISSQIAFLAPTQGILASNSSGTTQWYAWDIPSNTQRQITNTPGGHASPLTISPDGRWFYYLNDAYGNEIGHYVRRSISGEILQDLTPDLPLYSSVGFTISRTNNRLAFMAAYDEQFHILCMDIADDGTLGNLRKLYTCSHLLLGAALSHDGRVVFVMSTERTAKPQFSLLAFNTQTGEKISELWEDKANSLTMILTSPLPGDTRLLATTTQTGIETLLLWEPYSNTRIDLTCNNVTGSLRALDWSPDGKYILFSSFHAAVQQLYIHDLNTNKTMPLASPDGTHFQAYFTPDGGTIYSHWENATHPKCLIALSPQTGERVRTVISAGEVPLGHEWRSITLPSSDGQIVQGWLGIPDGEGPFPTIIETHGGPNTVQSNTFSPRAQAWLDHGFAYFSLNYRGSTTFGREFEQKIWGQLGYWEVEDLIATRHWLVQQNIALANSVLLTGWSYGGYLTLLSLGKAPQLWAGGMAGIAITDWSMSYDDAAETLRGRLIAFLGGTPEQKPEQYRLSSPISYVANIQAPVLIIQGRNDTRTPARPVQAYEAKMKSLGKDIEVHWFNTGHAGSFTSVEEGIRHQELMLHFAYRVLS